MLQTGRSTDYRLNPVTYDVVGFQIEGFLTHAVYQHPYLLDLALDAGVSRDVVEAIRARIPVAQRLLAAVDYLAEPPLPASA